MNFQEAVTSIQATTFMSWNSPGLELEKCRSDTPNISQALFSSRPKTSRLTFVNLQGCCPIDDQCTPNGCIHISGASVISASPTNATASAPQSSALSTIPESSKIVDTATGTGTPVTVTNTIIQAPEATATFAKDGEVASGVGRKHYGVLSLSLPYSSAWVLVSVAAVMSLL